MSNIPALAHGAFMPQRDGMVVRGNPPLEVWWEYGKALKEIDESWMWIFGDFLNAFERAYPEEVFQLVDATDYAQGTADNYMRACKRFPKDRRRIGRVKPSFFDRLSSIEDVERQEELLDKIEHEGWTKARLNQELSGPKPQAIEFEGTIRGGYGDVERPDNYILYYDEFVAVPLGKYKVRLTPIE